MLDFIKNGYVAAAEYMNARPKAKIVAKVAVGVLAVAGVATGTYFAAPYIASSFIAKAILGASAKTIAGVVAGVAAVTGLGVYTYKAYQAKVRTAEARAEAQKHVKLSFAEEAAFRAAYIENNKPFAEKHPKFMKGLKIAGLALLAVAAAAGIYFVARNRFGSTAVALPVAPTGVPAGVALAGVPAPVSTAPVSTPVVIGSRPAAITPFKDNVVKPTFTPNAATQKAIAKSMSRMGGKRK